MAVHADKDVKGTIWVICEICGTIHTARGVYKKESSAESAKSACDRYALDNVSRRFSGLGY